MAITVGVTWTYESAGTETEFVVALGSLTQGSTLIACLTKDDDVATTGPTGWTLQQGFESLNNIYTEIWKREVSATDLTAVAYTTEVFDPTELTVYTLTWNAAGTKVFATK